jgi:hypothetical protein
MYSTSSRPTLRPTLPPIQWEPSDPFPGDKAACREADHSLPTNAEGNKKSVSINPLPHMSSWCSVNQVSTGTTLGHAVA